MTVAAARISPLDDVVSPPYPEGPRTIPSKNSPKDSGLYLRDDRSVEKIDAGAGASRRRRRAVRRQIFCGSSSLCTTCTWAQRT
jgi:hypothetical protein